MYNPNVPRIIGNVDAITRPDPLHISQTALNVRVPMEQRLYLDAGQPLPTQEELCYLAARTILTARGVTLDDQLNDQLRKHFIGE